MSRVRIGSVGYLNAQPLVYGLQHHDDEVALRSDLPSACADLLHTGGIDLGLIPSLEYLRRPGYHIVPDLAIASDGAVNSVALFTARPIASIRSIALDTSSRTSVGLLRVLCRHHFGIAPDFVPQAPDLLAMTRACDAALLIGDPALLADYQAAGLQKIDLGEVWQRTTGLPFVWAVWAGRAGGPVTPRTCQLLREARDRGVARLDEIAGAFGQGDETRCALAAVYLRDNMKYGLDPKYLAGLRQFFDLVVEDGLAETLQPLVFFDDGR